MKKLVVTLCIILILCMTMIPTITYGTKINPDDYDPTTYNLGNITEITNKAGIIVSVLRTVGIVVMVVTLIILGIKYMIGSVEERADYKKSMIPYLVGATLLLVITQILSIIISFAEEL